MDVELPAFEPVDHLQRPMHQRFRVRARHEHAGVDPQAEAEKLPLAAKVGHRFAPLPTLHEIV